MDSRSDLELERDFRPINPLQPNNEKLQPSFLDALSVPLALDDRRRSEGDCPLVDCKNWDSLADDSDSDGGVG